MLVVTPIWIEPLFNKFGPMKDKALEAQILALADRAGIEGGRVYEVDKSVDTKTRQRLRHRLRRHQADRPLGHHPRASSTSREVLFVMGHEMGHYVLGHVWQLIAAGLAP